MSTVQRNLDALNAAADALLKSAKTEPVDDKDKVDNDSDIAPEEIADVKPARGNKPNEEAKDDVEPVEEPEDDDSDEDNIEKSAKIKLDEGLEEVETEDIEKSEDDVEPVEEPEDDDSDEKPEELISKSFHENEMVQRAKATNEVFEHLVDTIEKSFVTTIGAIRDNDASLNYNTEKLVKSITTLVNHTSHVQAENLAVKECVENLEKSIADKFDTLTQMIEGMSTQPAHLRKSVNVFDKDFNSSINGMPQQTGTFESLSKSQVLSVLQSELYAGNVGVQPADVIGYESGAPLREELKHLVVAKCK